VSGVREGVFDEMMQHESPSGLGFQEMGFLPPTDVELKWWETCFVLPFKVVKSFICCAHGEAEEWVHDTLTKRQVHSMIDDDWEFSDLAQYVQHHRAIRELDSGKLEEAMREDLTRHYSNELKKNLHPQVVVPDTTVLAAYVPNTYVAPVAPTTSECNDWVSSAVDSALEVSNHKVVLLSGLAKPRRRRRVVAGCVVALINKVRSKYFELRHTEANRRMVASYLMKLMREHHFRSCDIHLHVKYAVDVYFELQSGVTIRQAANRC